MVTVVTCNISSNIFSIYNHYKFKNVILFADGDIKIDCFRISLAQKKNVISVYYR